MNLAETTRKLTFGKTAVLRAAWLLLFLMVIGLLFLAVPSRYQMLAADVYGFGAGLADVGVSLPFFAVYFIFWELVLVSGSLLVAGIIGWRKADDAYALLVAILLTLLGLMLPLFDGLPRLDPLWLWPILAFRFLVMVCTMAVICLFPNGRFQPRWTRWLFVGWMITLAVGHMIKPNVLADTAVLPNTRTLADASYIFVAVAWLMAAVAGQFVRYRRLSSREERQQTRWVLFGALTMILFSLISTLLLISVPLVRDDARGEALFIMIMGPLYLLSALMIPVTIALAMLRYRLWEVDIFINRTLVYGGLTALITAVYILLVSSVGAVAINQSGIILGVVLATVIVALGLRPIRAHWQTAVDRYLPLPAPPPPQTKAADEAPPGAADQQSALPLRGVKRWLAWFSLGLIILLTFVLMSSRAAFTSLQLEQWLFYLMSPAYVLVGTIIIIRQPGNRIGRLCVLIGWLHLLVQFGSYEGVVVSDLTQSEILTAVAIQLSLSLGQVMCIVIFVYLPLLFPNGQYLSPRWRRFGRGFAVLIALPILLTLIKSGPIFDWATGEGELTVANPLAVDWRWLADLSTMTLLYAWAIPTLAAIFIAIASLVMRWQRSDSTTRQQIKWVVYFLSTVVAGFMLIELMLWLFGPLIKDTAVFPIIEAVYEPLGLIAWVGFPLVIGLAVLKYRLYDIDILINRTLVYGGLTALITAVYILLVGGAGLFTSSQSGQTVGLILATLLVIAFITPVKRSLQRGADRLVPRPVRPATAVAPAEPGTIHGRPLHLARLLWLGLLLLGLVMFGLSMAVIRSQNLWGPIIDGSYPIDIALLPKISGQFTTAIWLISYAQMAAFVLMGLVLFWRKSADRMGILASLMLIAVGLGFTANIILLPIFAPGWHGIVTIYQAIMFGAIVLFLFWFPDGRFYPDWTKFAIVAWFVYAALWLIWPALNPHRAGTIWPVAVWMVWVWLGVAAQFWRYRRRSDAMERQQTKWVIAGFIGANASLFVIILLFSSGAPANPNGVVALLATVLFFLAGLGTLLIPISISVSLFRYRLWEIDFYINRTLVYGGLTGMVLFIYALLVGGLSLLFQTQNSLLISLLATGLIAVLFQPIRARLQRGVNRLMFGERDDPYSVLSRLGRQLRETAVPDQTLPAITATITQTLKLPYAAIELAAADGERQTAATSGQKTAVTDEWPLIYQGEIVGWLQVAPRTPGEAFTSKERRLLEDIATQAGAAAYSVRLTTALQKSRERLVLAREEERRRIRRDLHDELGPSLASQTFKLDAALDLLESDPAQAAVLLQSLKTQNQALVADIRRLVYELRPPTLDDLGLMGALQAHIGQIEEPAFTLTAVPDPLPSLPAAVEVAVYRITLEATTNVVRHARATKCQVQVKAGPNHLALTISDDGVGLPARRQNGVGLQSMHERAEELGGILTVGSLVNGGVRVTAVLPLEQQI